MLRASLCSPALSYALSYVTGLAARTELPSCHAVNAEPTHSAPAPCTPRHHLLQQVKNETFRRNQLKKFRDGDPGNDFHMYGHLIQAVAVTRQPLQDGGFRAVGRPHCDGALKHISRQHDLAECCEARTRSQVSAVANAQRAPRVFLHAVVGQLCAAAVHGDAVPGVGKHLAVVQLEVRAAIPVLHHHAVAEVLRNAPSVYSRAPALDQDRGLAPQIPTTLECAVVKDELGPPGPEAAGLRRA
eukprot:2150831-Rhodomonas_salina.1